MKAIILTKGRIATVDDDDFDRVNQFNWCATKNKSGYYAIRRKSGGQLERLHNFILGVTGVDHRNGDGLDNQKENLRRATVVQNNQAFRAKSASATSRYRGVAFDSQTQKWRAKIGTTKKTIHLGRFVSDVEAARAYDKAATETFGEFAALNFP